MKSVKSARLDSVDQEGMKPCCLTYIADLVEMNNLVPTIQSRSLGRALTEAIGL